MKTFNTTGPIKPDKHYHIPALSRWDADEIYRLIEAEGYFVLHAPRQTGKTTCLLALMEKLNKESNYTALYVNVEPAQAARGRVEAGVPTVIQEIVEAAAFYLGERRLGSWAEEALKQSPYSALQRLLSQWCRENDRPIVLLLDEVDTLVGDTLISVLRQIRAGYPKRPNGFPQTMLLCGVRDVRDYRIHVSDNRGDNQIILGGSAFNIKSESLRLGNFSHGDIVTLYAQHTEETGQRFEDGVIDYVFEQTNGQPWLVNAIGYQACFRADGETERTRPVTLAVMENAREQLIERRDTHLDQLINQLQETRVHKVISELLSGDIAFDTDPPSEDDQLYVQDLGLIHTRPQIAISNPIYREIISRALTWTTQNRIPQETAWYVNEDGRLQVPELLDGFTQFSRENSESWIERFGYKEAGPQLLIQSFLQRIVNGGGRIDREYGLGRRRTDLLIQWPLNRTQGFYGPVQRVVIELKILRRSLETTLSEGLAQTADYMDRIGTGEGYLVIFDRAPDKPWYLNPAIR